MKRKLSQILLIIVIAIILTFSVFITDTYAESIAGINCPSSVNLNSNVNIALILPSNAYAAEATVTLTFSDGTTTSGKIVYVQGMEGSGFSNSVTLNAKVAGNATVTVSNIVISDSSSNSLETGGSKVQSLNIVAPEANKPAENNPAQTPQTPAPAAQFKDVNETVYLTDSCNVRESYSTSSNKITTLNKGTAVNRTGVSDNGWSRINYNGKTCYMFSQYLTTEKPADPIFTSVNETMYAVQDCNVRQSWSTSSEKFGYLEKGQEVNVIGKSTETGWLKIKYNDKEAYVASNLLANEYLEEDDDENENTVANEVTNEVVEEPKNELETLKNDIGVLPEVGKNISTSIYMLISIIAVVSLIFAYYYISDKKMNIE